jgi:hypothetical protein
LVPDLAVEVLSPSNTEAEMARKRQEYFAAGVRLVWMVDPDARTVTVYTAPDQSTVLGEVDTLSGDPVLPGFTLPLRDLFAELWIARAMAEGGRRSWSDQSSGCSSRSRTYRCPECRFPPRLHCPPRTSARLCRCSRRAAGKARPGRK